MRKTPNLDERARLGKTPRIEERASDAESTTTHERAASEEASWDYERAMDREQTTSRERAEMYESTTADERVEGANKMPTAEDRLAIRMLVRVRDDYQAMRKRMDNRVGRKADGSEQNIAARAFRVEDVGLFEALADNARSQEHEIEKMLLKVLKRFPVYVNYLAHVKGIGPVSAGWIVGEYDIHKATTVSKLWQFTGLNPGMVVGQRRVEDSDGQFHFERTDTLIRGDRLTPEFVAPFNQRLRTALVGVMADGFIKQQNSYALDYYYPYKARLEQEETRISGEEKAWCDVSKGRRDRAAKRYMVKMFLKDLYVAWRTLEGLSVRAPYAEEYLGRRHEPVGV